MLEENKDAMEKIEFEKEKEYLADTIKLVNKKLKYYLNYEQKVDNMLDTSNNEYLEYLRNNANKINDNDFV